jgi:Mg-chelatase subunit ChlD
MNLPEIDQTTLTAYALGELDALDRARVEAFLRESAFGRGYVSTIRRTGGLLALELEREAKKQLSAGQRSELERRISQAAWREPTARLAQRRWNRAVLAGSVAASTLIVGSLAVFLYSRIYRETASTSVVDSRLQHVLIHQSGVPPQWSPDGSEPPQRQIDSPDDPSHWAAAEPSAPLPANPLAGGDGNPLAGTGAANSTANALQFVTAIPHPSSARIAAPAPGVAEHSGVHWFDAYQHPKKPPAPALSDNAKLPLLDPAAFDRFADNPFVASAEQPVSGFAADVGSASYLNVRRALAHGQLPPADAVRVEELLNYFAWNRPPAALGGALAGEVELAACPWNPRHQLARILLRTTDISPEQRPAVNLVFLIDVSSSMSADGKLPLIARSLRSLLSQLQSRDRIAIVVAQSRRVLLPPTTGDHRAEILDAIDRLHAGDATAAGGGLEPAYATATTNLLPAGVNRVVLITDGHWLDGAADPEAIAQTIQHGAISGVPLSILATSPAYLDDLALRHLAVAGKGTLWVIDTVTDAGRAMTHLIDGSLIATADDVRIAVQIDPKAVASYRLLGYEAHASSEADSEDGPADADPGAIGAGHSITALYELVPARDAAGSPLSVRVTYRHPGQSEVDSLDLAAPTSAAPIAQSSDDFHFASAVAEFSMLLRSPKSAGASSFAGAIDLAERGKGADADQSRAEFIDVMREARTAAEAPGN